jgi:WD40 repeat protein
MAEASQLGQMRASGRIVLWDAAGREIHRFGKGWGEWCDCVAFSPDGRTLAAGARPTGFQQGGLQLWDLTTGAEVRRLGEQGHVNCIAFSPDGRLIAAGKGGEVHCWFVSTGEELRPLRGHTGGILSLAFSHDGARLASGSGDTTVLMWPVEERTRR